MGSKRNVDMSANSDEIKVMSEQPSEATTAEGTVEETVQTATAKRTPAGRSKKYQSRRSQVDKTREYDAFAAVELVKRLSYSGFSGTITADVVVKDLGDQVNMTFPNATGKTVRVAIASEELLAELENGTIEFDVLLTTPAFMPKLAKYARVLGPRGLMPNPKNGTLTAQPENKKKELEKGTFTLKTERKQPVIHVVIGTQKMETKELVENLQELMKALRGKAQKIALSATMSPSVKVKLETA